MKDFNSVDDILDFAMNEEQEAVDFYTRLALEAHSEDMKEVFEEFAAEEINHKARLMRIKEEGCSGFDNEKIADLKIADFIVNIKATPDMSYSDALVVAMKKEKAAYKLYMALADRVDGSELRNLFLSLAQEEAKHKLRFETEYDEFVLREN